VPRDELPTTHPRINPDKGRWRRGVEDLITSRLASRVDNGVMLVMNRYATPCCW
jgi:hypothetical protein